MKKMPDDGFVMASDHLEAWNDYSISMSYSYLPSDGNKPFFDAHFDDEGTRN